MSMVEGASAKAGRANRRAIPGDIIFDPHVTGQCVIIFDENAAATLFDLLKAWRGVPPPTD